MPELPDVTVYVEQLERRLVGATLTRVRVKGVNLLRTAEPPLAAAAGRAVTGVARLGKQFVIALERELFLALHLMIAGRLHWKDGARAAAPARALATFEFSNGTMWLTEAGTRQRAALHVVTAAGLRALNRRGVEPLTATLDAFRAVLAREDHTLKRALTDPRLFSGIGNSYSDEILHRARLSPLQRTRNLDAAASERLWRATQEILREWTERLREQTGTRFPEHVTAFREGMAVHGRWRLPCPDCGAPVQRIVYAENETNYCARCQTAGRLLADRALSRLLKSDWPRTLEELEGLHAGLDPGAEAADNSRGPEGGPR